MVNSGPFFFNEEGGPIFPHQKFKMKYKKKKTIYYIFFITSV